MSNIANSGRMASAGPRWLLMGSLALNLFFIGIAGSMAVRQYFVALPAAESERSDAARIEQIAATLPPTDADLLRKQFAARRDTVEAARETIRRKQNGIREALRAEPFDAQALRAATADSRAARENFYQVLQGVVSTAAEQMSAAGRSKLADWRPPPRS